MRHLRHLWALLCAFIMLFAAQAAYANTMNCTTDVLRTMGITEAQARKLHVGVKIPMPDGTVRELRPKGATIYGFCEELVATKGWPVQSVQVSQPPVATAPAPVAEATPVPQIAEATKALPATPVPAPTTETRPVVETPAAQAENQPVPVYGTNRTLWSVTADTLGSLASNPTKAFIPSLIVVIILGGAAFAFLMLRVMRENPLPTDEPVEYDRGGEIAPQVPLQGGAFDVDPDAYLTEEPEDPGPDEDDVLELTHDMRVDAANDERMVQLAPPPPVDYGPPGHSPGFATSALEDDRPAHLRGQNPYFRARR